MQAQIKQHPTDREEHRMKDPYLLHIFTPTKNVSPFDINMAYEAHYDAVIPYSEVGLYDIPALTQDTIFSRGPKGVKRTGIFIGGREFGLAIDMLDACRKAMVPPFEVSVFADPSGAITTAAALIAAVERLMMRHSGHGLAGQRVCIFGGTGPVGLCSGILAHEAGAEVVVVSHHGQTFADELAAETNQKFATQLIGGDGSSAGAVSDLLATADVVVGAAKAGIQVVSSEQLKGALRAKVVADVNAVPPAGIQGVGVHDTGVVLADAPLKPLAVGALSVGDLKYRVHTKLFQMMFESSTPLYLEYREAFKVARQLALAWGNQN